MIQGWPCTGDDKADYAKWKEQWDRVRSNPDKVVATTKTYTKLPETSDDMDKFCNAICEEVVDFSPYGTDFSRHGRFVWFYMEQLGGMDQFVKEMVHRGFVVTCTRDTVNVRKDNPPTKYFAIGGGGSSSGCVSKPFNFGVCPSEPPKMAVPPQTTNPFEFGKDAPKPKVDVSERAARAHEAVEKAKKLLAEEEAKKSLSDDEVQKTCDLLCDYVCDNATKFAKNGKVIMDGVHLHGMGQILKVTTEMVRRNFYIRVLASTLESSNVLIAPLGYHEFISDPPVKAYAPVRVTSL